MALDSSFWQHARDRVLNEAGRARVHDLRGHLNVVSLGLELVLPDQNGQADAGHTRARAAESMRREVSAADAELTGLQSLITGLTSPSARTLPEAAQWALSASAPVAERRAVDLVATTPVDQLPPVAVPDGLGLVLGLVLVEACLVSPRRDTCRLDLLARPRVGLEVMWNTKPDADERSCTGAIDALADLLSSRGAVEREATGSQRLLSVEFTATRPGRQAARDLTEKGSRA